MRMLILGGTAFLGRAVARYARDAGYDVTCLARGEGGDPVDGVRFLPADRNQPDALSILDSSGPGGGFDAVVDVTRRPSHARRAVQALADRVGHWSYVSSISVYADHSVPGQRADTAPVLDPAPETDDASDHPDTYGPRKVACERAVLDRVGPDRSLICRAGLIVGPEDGSGRFTYWVDRLARGGRVLAPGSPEDPVQLVDVRDLAQWLATAGERGVTGTYDATGPVMPRGECLARTAAGVGTQPSLTWVDQDFLQAHEVRPWAGPGALPLWLPLPAHAGLMTHDVDPAFAAGLATRSLEQTAADTLTWLTTAPGAPRPDGLAAADEAALLREWDTRAPGWPGQTSLVLHPEVRGRR